MMEQPSTKSSPATLYNSRLVICQSEIRRRRRQHLYAGYLRLLWAVVILLLAWFAFQHRLSWKWLVVPWIGFAVTAFIHAKILAAGARAQRGAAWYQHSLARCEDRWAGLHPRSTRLDTSTSVYATDLDLFGPASLFELLCTSRTSAGEDKLATWLLSAAERSEVLARQAALADLRDRVALRETMASARGPDVLALDADALARWGELQETVLPPWLAWVAPLLAAITIAAACWWITTHSPTLFLAAYGVDAATAYLVQRRLKLLFVQGQEAAERLDLIADLISPLEQETFTAPRLQGLQITLSQTPGSASQAIHHFARLSRADVLRNGLFRLIDIPLLYSVQLGLLMQRWRKQHGIALRSWLHALSECEALLSLSAFHFEHPDDSFPEIVPDGLIFNAEQLGHPLIPQQTCVRSDLLLDARTRLLLVSGSNMSGKSTLLRSIGINAVLALAGAPVRAHHLQLSPLQIGASIQINDSLQSGRSRFYAEILRLRSICDLARDHPPVLFLLDELLAGTNSRDRVAGATGLVRELLSLGAFGLLSTHDLALTEITGPESQHIQNVHFEDRIEGDRLLFDYILRPGIVTRSNGLDLMRMIGLDV